MLTDLKKFSSLFSLTEVEKNQEGEIFQFDDKKTELVLSAPHAVRSFVCKKVKPADVFTGEIVSYLGEFCNVSTIVRRRFVPYKCMIHEFIAQQNLQNKSFLDFHGMRNDRAFDLAVGTGMIAALNYKQEFEFIKQLAEKYKIKVVFNHPDYRGGAGLCGRLQREYYSDKVLQLEWRRDFRDFYSKPEVVCSQTIPFMQELIEYLRLGFRGK